MKKKEKPWGIFLPKGIQKIIYPQDKIDYEYGYILATFLRRISVIIFLIEAQSKTVFPSVSKSIFNFSS